MSDRVASFDGENVTDTGANSPALALSPLEHMSVQGWQVMHFAASQMHLLHHEQGPMPDKEMYDAANDIMQVCSQAMNKSYENVFKKRETAVMK